MCDPYSGQSSFVTQIRVIDSVTPYCYPCGMVDVVLYILCIAVSVWFGLGVLFLSYLDDDLGYGPITLFFLTPVAIFVVPLCELLMFLED
jgi:hypothetical protein